MNVSLVKMLKTVDPVLAAHIEELEKTSGNNSEDIRLDQEIQATFRNKCTELGLDVNDTSLKEFYHALQGRFVDDSNTLKMPFEELTKVYEQAFKSLSPKSLVIKSAVVKKILKANPPKNLIKQLGYRSLDSMLKREQPGELLLAAEQVESTTWKQKQQQALSKLRSGDFAEDTISFLTSSDPRWKQVAEKLVHSQGHTVLTSWTSGTIFMIQPPEIPGVELANAFATQRALQRIQSHGSLLRFVQVGKQFHTHFDQLIKDKITLLKLAKRDVEWPAAMRILQALPEETLQERFGLHVTPEDFALSSIFGELVKVHSSLSFWTPALQYLVVLEEGKKHPMSANSDDLICDIVPTKKTYENASHACGLQALEQELLGRYAAHNIFAEQVLIQLEHL